MTVLSNLPLEVFLDNLLPWLTTVDLIHLGETSRFFATLCNDETYWKRKLQQDFNFTGEGTARISGWKCIYRGLSNPMAYVWGESSKGRLGLNKIPRSTISDVPYPVQLNIGLGARIVNLSAAGMSFFALDSDGSVYVWGTLNGTSFALNHDGYSEPAKPALTPLKLAMPSPTRSISCGRLHATTLDDDHRVWTFLSWGRPFRLYSPALDATSFDSTPAQVESGWRFSSVLTKSGQVYAWWPFTSPLKDLIDERNVAMDDAGLKAVVIEGGIIPCSTWELQAEITRLPPLPELPQLSSGSTEPAILVKIAALESQLIGLTNYGHVLKISVENALIVRSSTWEYLPNFSEAEKIQQHPMYASSQMKPPQRLRISHVSAQYQTFVAYSPGSSSVVLIGSHETHFDSSPSILPALQNNDVISVVLGDYHYGALTSTGKLLTWGAYSRGALGLGDPGRLPAGQPGGYRTEEQRRVAVANGGPLPPAVSDPTEVKFDHGESGRKMFCFAVTAAGWHMGALVIDLHPETNNQVDNDEDEGPLMPGRFPRHRESPHDFPREPGDWRLPTMPMFRIGFAGRGATRGGHRGRGF